MDITAKEKLLQLCMLRNHCQEPSDNEFSTFQKNVDVFGGLTWLGSSLCVSRSRIGDRELPYKDVTLQLICYDDKNYFIDISAAFCVKLVSKLYII